jgi:predicted transglutaminase-like cysteine proteinase
MHYYTKFLSAIAIAVLSTQFSSSFETASASPVLNSAALRLPAASSMRENGRTNAPFAFLDFCRRHASECTPRGPRTNKIKLTPKKWATLQAVNSRWNNRIREVADSANPKFDHWTVASSRGDCEEFAIAKRRDLIRKGFPSSALAITVAKMRNGVGHAVLTVRTDRGDFVLDNLNRSVKPWTQVSYRWIKRQSSQNPKVWVAL